MYHIFRVVSHERKEQTKDTNNKGYKQKKIIQQKILNLLRLHKVSLEIRQKQLATTLYQPTPKVKQSSQRVTMRLRTTKILSFQQRRQRLPVCKEFCLRIDEPLAEISQRKQPWKVTLQSFKSHGCTSLPQTVQPVLKQKQPKRFLSPFDILPNRNVQQIPSTKQLQQMRVTEVFLQPLLEKYQHLLVKRKRCLVVRHQRKKSQKLVLKLQSNTLTQLVIQRKRVLCYAR